MDILEYTWTITQPINQLINQPITTVTCKYVTPLGTINVEVHNEDKTLLKSFESGKEALLYIDNLSGLFGKAIKEIKYVVTELSPDGNSVEFTINRENMIVLFITEKRM